MDLRSYRQKKGWTLESAAKFAGFANGTVWRRYETGERYPRPDALLALKCMCEHCSIVTIGRWSAAFIAA